MFVLERSNTVLFQLCYYWSAPIVTAPIITIGVIFHGSSTEYVTFYNKSLKLCLISGGRVHSDHLHRAQWADSHSDGGEVPDGPR